MELCVAGDVEKDRNGWIASRKTFCMCMYKYTYCKTFHSIMVKNIIAWQKGFK